MEELLIQTGLSIRLKIFPSKYPPFWPWIPTPVRLCSGDYKGFATQSCWINKPAWGKWNNISTERTEKRGRNQKSRILVLRITQNFPNCKSRSLQWPDTPLITANLPQAESHVQYSSMIVIIEFLFIVHYIFFLLPSLKDCYSKISIDCSLYTLSPAFLSINSQLLNKWFHGLVPSTQKRGLVKGHHMPCSHSRGRP